MSRGTLVKRCGLLMATLVGISAMLNSGTKRALSQLVHSQPLDGMVVADQYFVVPAIDKDSMGIGQAGLRPLNDSQRFFFILCSPSIDGNFVDLLGGRDRPEESFIGYGIIRTMEISHPKRKSRALPVS